MKILIDFTAKEPADDFPAWVANKLKMEGYKETGWCMAGKETKFILIHKDKLLFEPVDPTINNYEEQLAEIRGEIIHETLYYPSREFGKNFRKLPL